MLMSEGTSRGNQRKFYKDGYWVKIDNYNCSEGLAEDFVSCFENTIYDFPHVIYKTAVIDIDGSKYNICFSRNMYDVGVSFVSLRHIFKQYNIPLRIFIQDDDVAVNMKNVIDTVFRLLNVDISGYLSRLLFLDALIINEDRHYMNLGVCYKDGMYFPAQCFDNGSSLFCVNWTYRKRKSLQENLQMAKSVARPFSKFFDKQIEACIKLGAKSLMINYEGLNILLKEYCNPLYSIEMNNLVKSVLKARLDYYHAKGVYVLV